MRSAERRPFDELHDERDAAVRSLDTVDGGDVGMIQRGERFRFAVEPREALGIRGERFGQDFDRNLPPEIRVGGAVNLAHATRAKRTDDFKMSDSRA